MEADKPPALLEGETFVPGGSLTGVSLFDSPLHPSEVIHPKAELGTIWVTNFRTILRFYVSSTPTRATKYPFALSSCLDLSVESIKAHP